MHPLHLIAQTTYTELLEHALEWSRSIIIDFTWRNIKIMFKGDFEWLNTNTNSSYGVAVLLISRSRSIIIEYDRTFAMAFIIENGVGHVLGTQSSSGVANFLLFLKLIFISLSVISFIGRGVYSALTLIV